MALEALSGKPCSTVQIEFAWTSGPDMPAPVAVAWMSWSDGAVGPITTILPLKKSLGILPAYTSPNDTFWNVPAGNNFAATTPAQTLATHSGQISVISYSAPLGLLATGTPVTTRVWETSPARIAANICQSLKAPVLPTLWKEYLPDIPYTPVCG